MAGGLIVLPEMFATGFCMDAEITVAATQSSLEFLKSLAWQYSCHVIGGVIIDGQNCAPCVSPTGEIIASYAKQKLFTPAGEDKVFCPGNAGIVFNINDIKISPLICYDLRFPELFRDSAKNGAELFVVIAAWPASRRDHWLTLLKARAIENQACVIASNRIGKDPNTNYSGDSCIIDQFGEIISDFQGNCGILQAKINIEAARLWRENFPALRDAEL